MNWNWWLAVKDNRFQVSNLQYWNRFAYYFSVFLDSQEERIQQDRTCLNILLQEKIQCNFYIMRLCVTGAAFCQVMFVKQFFFHMEPKKSCAYFFHSRAKRLYWMMILIYAYIWCMLLSCLHLCWLYITDVKLSLTLIWLV